MIVCGMGLFIAVAADLVNHGRLQQVDEPIGIALHERSTPLGVLGFSAVSYLGDLRVMVPTAVLVTAWLAWRRRWRSIAVWLGALLGSAVINGVLKGFFQVPRPGRWTFWVFGPNAGYSFPSGHTMAVGVAAGTLALLVMHHAPTPPRTRMMAGFAVGALTVLVAFSLMYVGVHTLTDVLGGLAATLGWVGVIRWLLPPAGPSITRRASAEPR
jgi:undecaprenyl-diphosphatase